MKNIHTVFGSWGFIGSELVSRPDFVRNEPNPHEYRDKYLADYPDIVYLISTINNYNPIEGDVLIDVKTNIERLIHTLEANKLKYGNEFILNYISTWFVYGVQEEIPVQETACCSPQGFYSITKLAAEQLLASYCKTFDIRYRIIRLCNVLGIGDTKISPKRNALQYMIKSLAQGDEINLYDEDCKRDYLHVSDVCSAIETIVQYGELDEIYNVGGGIPHSIHHLINYAHRLSNYAGKINLIPVPEFHKTVQVKDMWLNNDKILKLGWRPQRAVEDVVEELIHYYKEINGQGNNPRER